ncbi:Fe/S biogenesis protein NfuA [Phycisphaerae bacterium RAS2]|nr:Fe/S biogenesis protein NfuA [Phycisphaerae bacterium RAS2]
MPAAPKSLVAPDKAAPESSALRDQVADIIHQLRPAVQSDGGDIELVDITPEGVVRVRLHGACIGCPSAAMTLKMGVEASLKKHLPQVREVVCV